MTGSLDTALSSIQTSVTSVNSLLKKRELWIKEKFQQNGSIITKSARIHSILIRIFGYLVQVICLILFYFFYLSKILQRRGVTMFYEISQPVMYKAGIILFDT
jgi:hypothetical protein